MNLPIELNQAIDEKVSKYKLSELKESAKVISTNYRNSEKEGKRLITSENEAISYAISRMPATYGAIYSALKHVLEIYKDRIETAIDVGAGTGAATWAINELIDICNITCYEKEKNMRVLGKELMQSNSFLENIEWNEFDLLSDKKLESADLCITAYVLNELKREDRIKALNKIWNATNKILVIVEPGTPEGYKELIELRELLIDDGGNIIAPCISNEKCKIQDGDWCSFECRIQRSRIHKMLKSGNVPYENEKFFYIAVTKQKCNKINTSMRILRHPQISNGRVELKVCKSDCITAISVTKKDCELYKIARKSKSGDLISR